MRFVYILLIFFSLIFLGCSSLFDSYDDAWIPTKCQMDMPVKAIFENGEVPKPMQNMLLNVETLEKGLDFCLTI